MKKVFGYEDGRPIKTDGITIEEMIGVIKYALNNGAKLHDSILVHTLRGKDEYTPPCGTIPRASAWYDVQAGELTITLLENEPR